MLRRAFVESALASSTLAIAGCVGSESEDDSSGDSTRSTPTDSSSASESDEITSSEQPDDEVDAVVENHQMQENTSNSTRQAWVDASITNKGGRPSGNVVLRIDWYDDNDEFLMETTSTLRTLRPGETWYARHYAIQNNEEVEDYQIDALETQSTPPVKPGGARLVSSELNANESSVLVEGSVENTGKDSIETLWAIARIYDDGGRLLGDGQDIGTDIKAGETWKFRAQWLGHRRNPMAAQYEVVFDSR